MRGKPSTDAAVWPANTHWMPLPEPPKEEQNGRT
nr:MAG TPA: Protein of unknown function (DUF551) [Caudoviricetes sp.]